MQGENIKLERFFELSVDMLCVANLDGFFVKVNPAFTKVLGYSEQELLENSYLELIHPDNLEASINELEKFTRGLKVTYFENRFLCKDGHYVWLAWSGYAEPDTQLIYAIARNITEQKEREENLIKEFNTDPLTNIPNRRGFEEQLDRELQNAFRYNYPIAILMIDIDELKIYNDSYGHLQGDRMICQVSNLLSQNLVRMGDIAARQGGDEFVVLLSHCNLENAIETAERLRSAVEAAAIPNKFGKANKIVTITIGATSTIPTANTTKENLLQVADEALYEAKNADQRNHVNAREF